MRHFLLMALLCLAISSFGQTGEKVYFIRAAKLYDPVTNKFLANQDIIVKGRKIEKVGPGLKKPETAEEINCKNCTVTPGLIDAHTHVLTIQRMKDQLEEDILQHSDIERTLRAVSICKSYLDAGFTTIRDLGNSGQFLDLNLKRAIQKGWVEGPRMVISGPILSPEDGQFFNLSSHNNYVIDHEYRVIKNVEDARQAVKDHIARGVDVIKVVMGDGRITLSLEEVKMIVQTAHTYGLKVTAHATYDQVIDRALEAEVDGIEHGYGIADSLLEKMARKKVYLVPTIGNHDAYLRLFKDNEKEMSPEEQQGLKSFIENSEAIVKKAIEKGVMVVNGSDMYLFNKIPQGEAAKNTLDTYFEACHNPAEVLKTATLNAAIACGVEGFTGIIKENMAADIVAFEGDLEKDFLTSLYKVKMVMKNGVILRR